MQSKQLKLGYDQKYLICALAYAVAGMSLGLFMAASHNHSQLVTHAHALLVGFVVSLLYALIHKLWLLDSASRVAGAQFVIHQVGAAALVVGLFELRDASLPIQVIEPVLALASMSVLAAALLMLVLVVRLAMNRAGAGSVSRMPAAPFG